MQYLNQSLDHLAEGAKLSIFQSRLGILTLKFEVRFAKSIGSHITGPCFQSVTMMGNTIATTTTAQAEKTITVPILTPYFGGRDFRVYLDGNI